MIKWEVLKEETLVSFLKGHFKEASNKFLRKNLEQNCCRVNGQVERFATRRVKKGDRVEFALQEKKIRALKEPPKTLYEDEEIRIVNKPSGLVCHPKAFQEEGLFLAHRLDKETTGALLLAKNKTVQQELFSLFRQKKLKKSYLALVDGKVKDSRGRISSFLRKKGFYQGQTIWGSSSEGLLAITEWNKEFSKDSFSLLKCTPKTGRTHQLRVHLAEMGHPILVDRQYAKSFFCPLFFPRVMLHAWKLEFPFRNQKIQVEAPLPEDMKQWVDSF